MQDGKVYDEAISNCFSFSLDNSHAEANIKHFVETNECINCDLSKVRLNDIYPDNANLKGALLALSSLENSQFNQGNFQDANLEYVDATRIIARYCTFTNADLKKTNFSKANLGGCDFANANLDHANFYHANLYKAKISDDQLKQAADLECAIMPDGSMHPGNFC